MSPLLVICVANEDRYVVRLPLWSDCRCDLYHLLETFFLFNSS